MAQSANCPRCDRPVEPEWRFCPHCEAVLQGLERGERGGLMGWLLDGIVSFQGIGWVRLLGILGGLGLFVIGMLVVSGLRGFGASTQTTIVRLSGLAASVLALGAANFCWLRDRSAPGVFESVLIGALALLGAFLVLSCALGGLALLFTSALL